MRSCGFDDGLHGMGTTSRGIVAYVSSTCEQSRAHESGRQLHGVCASAVTLQPGQLSNIGGDGKKA